MSDDDERDDRPIIEQLMPEESDVVFDLGIKLVESIDQMTAADFARWGPPASIPHGTVCDPSPDPIETRLPAKRRRKKGSSKIDPHANATHWRTWADEIAGIPPEPIPPHLIEKAP